MLGSSHSPAGDVLPMVWSRPISKLIVIVTLRGRQARGEMA